MKKYLPSKKFLYVAIVIVVLGIITFLIFNFSTQKKLFFFGQKQEGGIVNERINTNNLLKIDTDNDGIPDWEETLWGTNKENKTTFDGVSDSIYIEEKKKELNVDQTKDAEGLTETEKFAREFFATYVAMKTGGSDADAIKNFSSALGEKIIYPNLLDNYTEKDIKINNDDTKEKRIEYYNNLKKIFENSKSKGMGDELSLVAGNLSSSINSKNNDKLLAISNTYQDFSKNALNLLVPKSLTNYHIKIVNSANNTGISVRSMIKISNDPIIGLSGISQYEKYSNEFIAAVKELETKL